MGAKVCKDPPDELDGARQHQTGNIAHSSIHRNADGEEGSLLAREVIAKHRSSTYYPDVVKIKSNSRALLALMILVSGALLASCSTTSSGAANPPLNIAGAWSGASFPGCRSNGGVHCYKRPISFALIQDGDAVSGSYSCPVGNIMCGTDNSGNVVNGKMDGASLSNLRVVFSDATNCAYQGQFTASEGTGAYMCFAGAGRIVEQGGWQLMRTGQ